MSRSAAVAKRVQYAALPYRLMGRSRTEVMLVTSLRYATLDHPQGLAAERPGAASFGRARSVRRGRRRGRDPPPLGRIVSLSEAPQERRRRRLRGGGLRAQGAAAEQAVAGKRRAPGQVGVRQEAAETVREPKLSTIIRRWAPKSRRLSQIPMLVSSS